MSTEQHHIYTNDEATSKNKRNMIIFFGLLFFSVAMFLVGLNFEGQNIPTYAVWCYGIFCFSLVIMCVFGMFCEDFSEPSVEQLKELSDALSVLPDVKRVFSEALAKGKKIRKRDLSFVKHRHAQVQRENMLKSIQELQ